MSNKAIGVVALVVVLAALTFVASQQFSSDSSDETILVLCGGSMRGALEEIKSRYQKEHPEAVIETTYGGSGELCAQIQSSGKGDIYICHDPFMPWAADKGLISKWDTVAALDVVIVVPKGNPKGIQTLQDLGQPDLRVGIGNQTYSTSGQIVKHMLEGQPFGPDILKNVRVETKGHQQRCNDIAMGTLDAGIAWNAVAQMYAEKLDIIPIPKIYVDTITTATYGQLDLKYTKVAAGIISGAKDRKDVQNFFEFITTQGKDVFKELGFSPVKE